MSEFDDAFEDVQMNFVPGPNEPDIQRRRLLKEIDNDLSCVSRRVCRIGEKIEQLKTFEGRY